MQVTFLPSGLEEIIKSIGRIDDIVVPTNEMMPSM